MSGNWGNLDFIFFFSVSQVGFVKQRDSFRPCPADADGDDCHFDLDFSGIGAGMSAGFVCTAILVCM